MRLLVDRDRQVEGLFTGYSAAMERSVLNKDKYLNDVVGAVDPPKPVAGPVVEDKVAPPPSAFGGKLLEALGTVKE